ncbi:hypothetical protein HanIR_Chr04g0190101 [Helianthus annuus]|nr:hypothetical protein HanIR_Chr04g0190101 [Helianthus annuus]
MALGTGFGGRGGGGGVLNNPWPFGFCFLPPPPPPFLAPRSFRSTLGTHDGKPWWSSSSTSSRSLRCPVDGTFTSLKSTPMSLRISSTLYTIFCALKVSSLEVSNPFCMSFLSFLS